MKYHTILGIVFLLSTLQSQSQFKHGSITLSYSKKLKHIEKIPFNEIIVLDNRFDTTNFLIDETHVKNPEMDCFSKPASEEIRTYIQKITAPFPKESNTVYINIKQLRFGNLIKLSRTLFFSADAFIRQKNGFKKILSIKNEDPFRRNYNYTIVIALNNLIQELCSHYYHHHVDTIDYTLGEINKNIMLEWASYPIIKQNNLAIGTYSTFDNFRNNKIDSSRQFILKTNEDSTYHVSFSDSNKYYKNKTNIAKSIFAICYNGNLYISIYQDNFIPLQRQNNSFYFSVPTSLPNMYSIIFRRMFPGDFVDASSFGNVPLDFSGAQFNNGAAVLIGLGIIATIGITVAIVNEIKKKNQHDPKKTIKPIHQKIVDQTMRDCFLDMDSGDIVYH